MTNVDSDDGRLTDRVAAAAHAAGSSLREVLSELAHELESGLLFAVDDDAVMSPVATPLVCGRVPTPPKRGHCRRRPRHDGWCCLDKTAAARMDGGRRPFRR